VTDDGHKHAGIATVSFLPIRPLAAFSILSGQLFYRPGRTSDRPFATVGWEDTASGIRPRNTGILKTGILFPFSLLLFYH
jgi:hypothetical protein